MLIGCIHIFINLFIVFSYGSVLDQIMNFAALVILADLDDIITYQYEY